MKIFPIILLFAVAFLLPHRAIAATDVLPADEQIKISSDRLEADEKKKSVTFYGNVVGSRGSVVPFFKAMSRSDNSFLNR